MSKQKVNIKAKLQSELTELAPESVNRLVADRAGCSSENVRMWFKNATRKSAAIEKAAFDLLTDLREAKELKLQKLQS